MHFSDLFDNLTKRALLILVFACVGCASHAPVPEKQVVFFVPGVGGNVGYNGLLASLRAPGRAVHVVNWGAPTPLFFLNFDSRDIHDAAEVKLAAVVDEYATSHPQSRIELVGHSAGCGVILGGVPRLTHARIDRVILLAAATSPQYDVHPALAKIDGRIDSFFSHEDILFLHKRASTGGCYDGPKTDAAGFGGFVGKYPAEKFVQHEYQNSWRAWGNTGSHYGWAAREFDEKIIAPLLK